MTRDEMEAYATHGTVPAWFEETIGESKADS
jgi:hypothetical protein